MHRQRGCSKAGPVPRPGQVGKAAGIMHCGYANSLARSVRCPSCGRQCITKPFNQCCNCEHHYMQAETCRCRTSSSCTAVAKHQLGQNLGVLSGYSFFTAVPHSNMYRNADVATPHLRLFGCSFKMSHAPHMPLNAEVVRVILSLTSSWAGVRLHLQALLPPFQQYKYVQLCSWGL